MTSSLRIVLSCPRPKAGNAWGDWYFGRSLAQAFARCDVRTFYDFASRGHLKSLKRFLPLKGKTDLVIRGPRPYTPMPRRPFFLWIISHPEKVSDAELLGATHVFVASRPQAKAWLERGIACTFLPQCTDQTLFFPRAAPSACRSDVLFVGNRRKFAPRPVVDLALRANLDLQVWGRGWDGLLSTDVWKGQAIPNDQLGLHYSGANVVLNDHTSNMLESGFASNRIFDVLASGTPLLTEVMEDLPDVAEHFCFQYTEKTFEEAIEKARSVSRARQKEAAAAVLAHHTFENRAAEILQVMRG